MADLKTATSAVPSVLVAGYLPTTEAAQYTAIPGTTVQFTSAFVTNTDTVSRTVTLSIVKSGGTAGGANRILPTVTLPAFATVDLGELFLGEGDFISGAAGTASTITLVMTGIVFSSTTTGAPSGIQDDAIGSGGHGTGTVSGTNKIGTGGNRYLFGALLTQPSTFVSSYDTLTMSCTDGAMTPLVHADFNYGSGAIGSVYLFGRANPTSGTTQTLTGSVTKAGVTFNTVMGSLSKSGVGSVTGAVSNAVTTPTALSLAVTSAAGHVPVFATVFRDVPLDSNLRTRYFNGVINAGATVPQFLLMSDALGAATVTGTTSNASYYASVGVDVIPA